MTALQFGLEAPIGLLIALPPYQLGKVQVGDYPFLHERKYSKVAIYQHCLRSIQCRFWQSKSWESNFVDLELPCGYLVYDVCAGTYACECSNGYTMTTIVMPERNGQEVITNNESYDNNAVDN